MLKSLPPYSNWIWLTVGVRTVKVIVCGVISKCNAPFTTVHANIYNSAGATHRRHDRVKNVLARYLEKAYGLGSTVIEPSLGQLDTNNLDYLSGNLSHNARTDIAVMGFEKPFVACYIDVSRISPVCESNKSNSIGSSLSIVEEQKVIILCASKNI